MVPDGLGARLGTAVLALLLVLTSGMIAGVPRAAAETVQTRLVSRAIDGAQANGHSPQDLGGGPNVALSADGRYVAFSSSASNLLGPEHDDNVATDVFRYDRLTGDLVLVSQGRSGGARRVGDLDSGITQIDISADGNLVVFDSLATTLTDDVINAFETPFVFVRDIRSDRTVLVSRDGEGPTPGTTPTISSNGSHVAWGGAVLRRIELGYDDNRALVGTGSVDTILEGGANPSISGDGRYVLFDTTTALDERDAGRDRDDSDVYRWDGEADGNAFALVSLTADGTRSGNGPSTTLGPRALSDDGMVAGLVSSAGDLLPAGLEVPVSTGYVRTFGVDARTVPVAVNPGGGLRPSGSPQLSRDGTAAAFTSTMGDLVVPPVGDNANVFVRSLDGGGLPALRLASQSTAGVPGDAESGHGVLDRTGSVVAFGSHAENLVADDGNGEADVFVRASAFAEPVTGLALSVDIAAGPPSVSGVDLGDVDLSALPLLPGDIEAAPLRSSPLRSSPLRSSPLRSSPLRSSPLRSSPLRSSPLRSSPLRSSPLRSSSIPAATLASVPVLLEGGWAAILEGPPATPYAGLPLQSVTLEQLLSLPEGAYPQVDALTLEDIDITATPLGQTSLQVFLFAGPSLSALSSTAGWCTNLAAAGFLCADHGITEGTSTLLDLSFAGAPINAQAFLPELLVRDAELTGSPVASYDVASVDVDATALGGIPVTALPVGIVDCTDPAVLDCSDPAATLGRAVRAGAIVDGPTAVLGRILAVDALVGQLTFGDVVRMLVDPAKLSYGDVPLLPLLLGTPVEGRLEFTASAAVVCADANDLTFEVTLPPGFRYQPGSAELTFDGIPVADPGDPTVDPIDPFAGAVGDAGAGPLPQAAAPKLTWRSIGDRCAADVGATTAALSFRTDPWVELGTKTSSVTLTTPSGTAQVEDTAPFRVEDAHEPNDTPEQATAITPGMLLISHLGAGDAIDHVTVQTEDGEPLPRGSIVTATLSHLPADFDLRIDGPSVAPLRSSPLRSSPLRSSPIEDPGLSIDPAGQVIGPDLVEDVPRADTTLSRSAHRGLASEVVSMIVPPDAGSTPLTLAVSSYLGSSSDRPYSLQVMVEPPPELGCTPQTAFSAAGPHGTLPSPASLDPGTRTLVLVNEQRFDALHGAGATQQVRDALAAAIPAGDQAGPAAVLPLDGDAGVRTAYGLWDGDPCEPERANDVVRQAVRVLDPYATALPELRFVVVIGDDNVLPSYRMPDATTLANQREYYPELVLGDADNPLSAAAAYGYVLTDSAYTELDEVPFLDHELLVPDLAGGRLVETLPEILGTIDRYASQKHVAVDSSLLAAYDFLVHGGQDTQDILASRPGTDPAAARSLISNTWTKGELLAEIARSPDLTGVWAHYDHSRLLTAAGDAMPNPVSEIASSSEALAAGLAQGTLYFTLGCNAGLNVPALAWVGATGDETARLLDWPQATAQRRGAFFGNTGFGYGDSVVSAYGERLMTLFAASLDGSMTIGQAAVAARHAYLEEAALDVYTSKTIAEATLYGLPFVRVGATGQVAPAPAAKPRPPAETGPVLPDPLTGRPSTSFDLTPTFDQISTVRGDYVQARLGGIAEPTLKALYRPVQPAITLDLPAPPAGQLAGDLLITGLTSEDTPLPDPVFVRPTFDLSANEPEPLVRDVAYPVSMGNVTPTGNLLLHAGQLRRTSLTDGTQTRYTRIAGKVLYGTGADPLERPRFDKVEALTASGSGATAFDIVVDAADRVLVLYRSTTSPVWKSLVLTLSPSGSWTGGVGEDVSEYFVQAVRGAAVASARGKGLNFQPQDVELECPTFGLARTELDLLRAAGGITAGLEDKIRHALDTAELWIQDPRRRGPALSHLDRAIHLLLWQADVVEKGKPNQGDPVGLRALADTIGRLKDCL